MNMFNHEQIIKNVLLHASHIYFQLSGQHKQKRQKRFKTSSKILKLIHAEDNRGKVLNVSQIFLRNDLKVNN